MSLSSASAAMIDCIATRFSSSLAHADGVMYPFRHWLLNRILPDGICKAIDALPVEPPAWGMDLLDGPDRLVLTTAYQRNFGLIFIPAANTWHGFHRRPISGVRRSLIVNYVKPEWRSRNELAFPDCAVLA